MQTAKNTAYSTAWVDGWANRGWFGGESGLSVYLRVLLDLQGFRLSDPRLCLSVIATLVKHFL